MDADPLPNWVTKGGLALGQGLPVKRGGTEPTIEQRLAAQTRSGQTLICGFDGSEDSVRAVGSAARLAVAVDSVPRVVCVLDDDTAPASADLPSEDELQDAAAAVPDGAPS